MSDVILLILVSLTSTFMIKIFKFFKLNLMKTIFLCSISNIGIIFIRVYFYWELKVNRTAIEILAYSIVFSLILVPILISMYRNTK
ncbi:hypothetical protein B0185_04405 [Haemophilus parahaemolyticus]|nr:hypothetical protein B0185_04405 [Haemophilus parahaemolyticus]